MRHVFARRPRRARRVVAYVAPRQLELYPVLARELEEFASPWLTLACASLGVTTTALVATVLAVTTMSLDPRQLLYMSCAAAASSVGVLWSLVEVVRAYRRLTRLVHALRAECAPIPVGSSTTSRNGNTEP